MKLRHFFRLKPHCLACASEENGTFPLAINRVEVADSKGHENESIIEGVIRCSNLLCQCEYPIIDGIPFLLPNVRETLAASIGYIQARSDLCATTQSLLSDCCAPDLLSSFSTSAAMSLANIRTKCPVRWSRNPMAGTAVGTP